MSDPHQQELFTRLWTEAQPSVAGYLYALACGREMADELLQQTALVALRKFEDYDSERAFLPWVMGIAKFELLAVRRDTARAGEHRKRLDDALIDAFTDQWLEVEDELAEEREALDACLETLAPKAREVIRWRYFESLTSVEIAERLGAKAGSVRVMLQRIRNQLQHCIQQRLNLEGKTE